MASRTLGISALLLFAVLAAPRAQAQACTSGTNTALSFDGVDDWVLGPTSGSLDGFNDFTIEFWARWGASTNVIHGDMVISKWRSFDPNPLVKAFGIRRTFAGELFIQLASGLTPSVDRYIPGLPLQNVWNHIAVTRLQSQVSVYFNGALIDSYAFSGTMNTSSAPLVIGNSVGSNDLPYGGMAMSGNVDEVRIWNVARTQAEILSLINTAASTPLPGLVAEWRFDEAIGQTAFSTWTAGLNATLGATTNSGSDDPAWTSSSTPPLLYCPSGTGQPNSSLARLHVNGQGVGTTPGPFSVLIPSTGPEAGHLTLQWSGPPGSPLALAVGTLAPHTQGFPCTGSLDLAFAGLNILFDGTTPPMSFFFSLNGSGTAFQAFSLPLPLPAGPLMAIQGAVIQPGCSAPIVLTAAFQLSL